MPLLRTPGGYEAVGACSLEQQRRTAERLEACFGLADAVVRDEVFHALRTMPRRCAAGEDPGGRVNARAFDACAAMPAERRGVWLLGNVGSGKSFLAWHALARLVTQHGVRGVYLTEAMLREAWRVYTRSEGDDPWAYRLLRAVGWPKPDGLAQVIMLDEFGSLREVSRAANDLLDHVVHTAHAAGCMMLVTSNRAGQQLLDERGDRALSRIREICGAPITLTGDWRVSMPSRVAT